MSTNNNEQNGCQPPLSNHPTPPSDPRTGSVSDLQKQICRKYVWGTCTKNAHCRFRHELDYDEMKKILKFCHDYQNKQGCTRVDCTYLHATRDEQNSFLATGQLPRVLAERYAAMSETSSCVSSFEAIPQMVMFVTPPPPPPPPPPPAPLLTASAAPPPPPPIPFQGVQQPPPPPPPPTMPSTSVVQTNHIFSGPPPQNPVFPMNLPPPPLPPLFDASRPPPPILGQTKNGAMKRRLDICEAGPSKLRKAEESKVAENRCENCMQREIRIDLYKQRMEKLLYQNIVYTNKLQEYENGKDVLRSLVSPELYRILDEYIEGGPPQVHPIIAQISQPPYVLGSSSTSTYQQLLLDYLINNSRSPVDSALAPLRDDTLLQSLTMPRRSNTSTELVHALLEMFCNVNGQKADSSPPVVSASSPARYQNTSTTTRAYQVPSVAGPSGLNSSASQAQTQTSPSYPTYHPGVPPPATRPYYSQSYGPSTSNASIPNMYNTPARAAASMPQAPIRPPTSTITNYNPYMMGRYPHPPQYYPPFQ